MGHGHEADVNATIVPEEKRKIMGRNNMQRTNDRQIS